jgi:hypothetical protein
MFAILIFTLYIIALVITNKIDIKIDSLTPKFGHSMEEFVASKKPQSTAEAEHWVNEYMRKTLF